MQRIESDLLGSIMTPFDEIKRQIDQKRKEIAELEEVAQQPMQLYSTLQFNVELAEIHKPDVKSQNLASTKKDPSFITIKVRTSR